MHQTCSQQQQPLFSRLTSYLSQETDLQLAILFGSIASGQATAESDLDVALLYSHPLNAEDKMRLIEALSLICNRPVDLVDMHTAGVVLMGQVFKGRRLLGSNQVFGEQLSRHLVEVADFLPLQQRILAERRARWINS